jgi:hypothetical protein
MTLQEFIEQNCLAMTVDPVTVRPDGLMDEDIMSHYRVTLHRGKVSMGLCFSMGMAHTEPPKLEDVLDCLMLDAASVEYADDVNDWLEEMGHDVDKMPHGEFLQQERVYRTIVSQARELENLLGSDEWAILRNEVEAL